MTIDTSAYATFLEKVAEDIDIAPHKYQQAVDDTRRSRTGSRRASIPVVRIRRTSTRRDRSGWGPSSGR